MATLLADREAGRDRLLAEIGRLETEPTRILAHPALVHRFEAKVGRLRAALNDPLSRLSASSIGTPARLPLSTSALFTHSSSACGTQPIFSAVDTYGIGIRSSLGPEQGPDPKLLHTIYLIICDNVPSIRLPLPAPISRPMQFGLVFLTASRKST